MKKIFKFFFIVSAFSAWSNEKIDKPNVIYILSDDQGYGDVSALNPQSKIKTPHIDRLASEGITFTDAHSSSSVCTPTRYQLLTGRYNWRTHLKSSVIDGYGKPLIAEDRLTYASILQQHGYQTAMIGKWHLGMDLPITQKNIKKITRKNGSVIERVSYEIDWSKPIGRTPISNGFDYFWGHGASLDYSPYVYIENNRYTSTKVSKKYAQDFQIKKGFRPGPVADNFNPRTTLDEFKNRSVDYIQKWDGLKPFALYVPLTSPHTPIIPNEQWLGKSGIGDYGDFVMETDAVVGAILDAVEKRGIAKNTIIVFTADNGCSPAADIKDLSSKGHEANHTYRGAKADIFEGGHRVPHLIRWPAVVKAGSTTDRLTVLGDIFATMADIIDAEIPQNAAEDSQSFYPELLGMSDPKKQHVAIINHSINGSFAVRTKKWKLAFCAGSGGWSQPKDDLAEEQGLPQYQLYDMINDPTESQNLYEQKPEIVEELIQLGSQIVLNGRSTPGEKQLNDTPNDWPQIHWVKKP